MKKLTISLITTLTLTIGANAGKNVAPPPSEPIPVILPLGLYFGAGASYDHSECKCDTTVKFTGGYKGKVNKGSSYGINLKAGYYVIDEYLAIEAKYIYNAWGDNYKGFKHYGLYFKPTYPVTQNLDIYALIGYGMNECEALNKKEGSIAWGGGAEYTFGTKKGGRKDGWGVYVEYLRPLKKDGKIKKTVDVINAGVSYNF